MNLRLRLLILTAIGLAAVLGSAMVVGAQPGGIKTYPSDGNRGVSPGTQVTISFPEEMDPASVVTALSIEPEAAGAFAWTDDYRQAYFRPHEPLLASTRYSLRLDNTVRTASGRALLSTPYYWAFETSEDRASLRFSYGVPVAFETLSGGRRVTVQASYPRLTLDCALYSITVPQFAALYAEVAGSEQQKLTVDGLPLVGEWQGHVDASEGTGYVTLSRDVAPGLYVLDVRHPRVGDAQSLLILSDHAMVAKRGTSGQLAWVGEMPDGTPVSGATVEAVDEQGAVTGTAVTDADGVARFAGEAPAFAVAHVGDEITLVGFDGSWVSRNYYYYWGDGYVATPAVHIAHIHTDRPIYRPGHTVHYKATLRNLESDGLSVIEPGTLVTATVRDTSGNVVASSNPQVDEFGSIAGDLLLDADASLGGWRIEVKAGWQTFSAYFQVEEYVKPDFEVAIETDEPYYVRGDQAKVTVQADYYFGQPVTDADVTVRVYRG
ncbi:MAG: MG2 domain-containing protein, partial [Anaerolineae bacterium]